MSEKDTCPRCKRGKLMMLNRLYTSLMVYKCTSCKYEIIMKYKEVI